MKKFLSMILTVVTVFSIGCFTGCDNKSTGNVTNETVNSESTPTADGGSSPDATVDSTPTPDSEMAEMKKAFKEANVGEYVTFGHYEQDNDTSNGKEDIEWLVLEKEDNKVLVISKYILLNGSSGGKANDNTLGWKNCGLRTWINDEFLNDAFNLKEQSLIKDTINQNELIPVGSEGSEDTERIKKAEQYVANLDNSTISTTDKVFVLSKSETEKYFPTDESRRCAVSRCAYEKIDKSVFSNSKIKINERPTCAYYTRSCNIYTEIDSYDNTLKGFSSHLIYAMPHGSYSDWIWVGSKCGIRPAMWISTN